MGRLLVSIGTDGITDWVRVPEGQKFNLGPVSVLRLMSSTMPRFEAKRALDDFLKQGEVLVSLEEDKMWSLLAPHRARWSADVGPFMSSLNRDMLSKSLIQLERHVAALNEAAIKKASNLQEGVTVLEKLARATLTEGALVQSNLDFARTVLARSEATLDKITRLATAGRRFNASRARRDVLEITYKVAEILEGDLSSTEVRPLLEEASVKANQIHGLFSTAKL